MNKKQNKHRKNITILVLCITVIIIVFTGCINRNSLIPIIPGTISNTPSKVSSAVSPINDAVKNTPYINPSSLMAKTYIACATQVNNGCKNKFPAGWSYYTNANEINELTFDHQGNLWAASVGGVTRWDIKSNQYTRYTDQNGLPDNTVSVIRSVKDGSIWIGTPFGGIARFNGDHWQTYHIPQLFKGMPITDIHQDRFGNIWFATYGAGVIRFDGASWKVYLLEDGLASVAVESIAEDNKGNLWFNTFIPCCESLDTQNIHAAKGTDATLKPGISRFDGHRWVRLP